MFLSLYRIPYLRPNIFFWGGGRRARSTNMLITFTFINFRYWKICWHTTYHVLIQKYKCVKITSKKVKKASVGLSSTWNALSFLSSSFGDSFVHFHFRCCHKSEVLLLPFYIIPISNSHATLCLSCGL